MRIWSLHPCYLDTKGLVALWRETLLAKHVLEGKTKGYLNHPQLQRFKATKIPADTINQYLAGVLEEATNRHYNFDKEKVRFDFKPAVLTVTRGQVDYEVTHLLAKLKVRDPERFLSLKDTGHFELHPLFKMVDGGIEGWEIIKK